MLGMSQYAFLLNVDSSDFEQVKVLSHSSYVGYEKYEELWSGKIYEGDMFHVVGEIQNIGTTNVEELDIIPVFYDAGGSIMEAGPVRTSIDPLDILIPNRKSPFEVILLDVNASQEVSSYDLSIEFSPTTKKPYNPEVVNHSSTILTYLTVFGEVLNMNDTYIQSLRVLVTFYDEAGKVIDADCVWLDIETLLPNQRFPFELSNYDRPEITDEIKGYELCAQAKIGIEIPYTEFQILSSDFTTQPYYEVSGEVKNIGSRAATFVRAAATCYDSNGNVVCYERGLIYIDATPSDLSAGETGTFKITLYRGNLASITSYSVQVYCLSTAGASSSISFIFPSFYPFKATINLGNSITVSGCISPPRTDADVILTYVEPDGTAIRRTVATNATGNYTDVFTPDKVGDWMVTAAWAGDEEYQGAYSIIWQGFTVQEAPTTTPPVTPPPVTTPPTTTVPPTTTPPPTSPPLTTAPPTTVAPTPPPEAAPVDWALYGFVAAVIVIIVLIAVILGMRRR
jgi:hypothetical protein